MSLSKLCTDQGQLNTVLRGSWKESLSLDTAGNGAGIMQITAKQKWQGTLLSARICKEGFGQFLEATNSSATIIVARIGEKCSTPYQASQHRLRRVKLCAT